VNETTNPNLVAIHRLHAHRRWVNARLLASARGLSETQRQTRFDIGMGSVWDTLVHLYAAEYVWLEALQGHAEPPPPRAFSFSSLAALDEAWTRLDARWGEYLSDLRAQRLGDPVAKRSTSSRAGRFVETPVLDVLLHVCTHAQYTTAQLVNMLRRLGVAPEALPDTMLITLSRDEHAPAT